MTIKDDNINEAIHRAELDEFVFDLDLEPHVLTDKEETKALPCRVCKRPCIVTRFASANKTACRNHRDRHAAIEVVHELKSDLEPHVLTDKEETKEVPCRHCGRPCIVTLFASASKVACRNCRKTAPRPKKTTEFSDNGSGRMVATTKTEIVSERDMAWIEWTVTQPFHFERIWTDEDKAEQEKLKQERIEAHQLLTSDRQTRWLMRDRLASLPSQSSKPKIQEEIKDLESKIETLESEEVSLEDQMRIARDAADRLARIAYFRGALANGYRIETRDGGHCLVGREQDIKIPGDFLDQEGYARAESTVPALA